MEILKNRVNALIKIFCAALVSVIIVSCGKSGDYEESTQSDVSGISNSPDRILDMARRGDKFATLAAAEMRLEAGDKSAQKEIGKLFSEGYARAGFALALRASSDTRAAILQKTIDAATKSKDTKTKLDALTILHFDKLTTFAKSGNKKCALAEISALEKIAARGCRSADVLLFSFYDSDPNAAIFENVRDKYRHDVLVRIANSAKSTDSNAEFLLGVDFMMG